MERRVGDTFVCRAPEALVLEDGFRFAHGPIIAPFRIVYETFGELNADRSNAILVCHALSASAHAAGKYDESDEKPGWWDGLIGYGKPIDLEKYFVVCVNLPGSPFGTTAPKSVNPATGRAYGSHYPWPMIEDMVESQRAVLQHLGITHLRAIAGGSLGGMQVLMWAALYPEFTDSIIAMATGSAVPVTGIAWHILGRKIIETDQRFQGGDYYELLDAEPLRGLQVARMLGHMTYLSAQSLQKKFARRRRGNTRQFEIDSYFEHQGKKFASLYDANSYIRVQAAMDEMDLEEQFGSLQDAFARWRGRTLIVSFDTDWLFPVIESERVTSALQSLGVDVQHESISSANGHDTFLIDYHLINPVVERFLASL